MCYWYGYDTKVKPWWSEQIQVTTILNNIFVAIYDADDDDCDDDDDDDDEDDNNNDNNNNNNK